ncbi:family 78 glycoside hydrolase catalytic domain [Paenibacillus sp. YN15]|uniref:family 78 glycoside hydrolase catalytic domain n=1 Tax=Paenibacillus sp. YN15 TaxID=1742774 RepID=UPI000DCF3592|nr:family 78 glycoside hydrolase catalytic domain [Paenibacillus sp. YN15]RAV04180.1 alpha-L-rhamnosidase [Paenibacillus sp. YN15]
MQHNLSAWQARWIWGGSEASPRNEWRCFRKSFFHDHANARVSLKLTADSRYILYVNGVRLGRGPVRSWQSALAYDEYDLTGLLLPGARNAIAVLVNHYGIPTFQYLRGRGGLLVQLETGRGNPQVILATDGNWKTAIYQGMNPLTSRMSCQLPFVEAFDARLQDEEWTGCGYNDDHWEPADELGPAGMEPWTGLVPREIPMLTEEPVYPVRVEEISRVRPRTWGAVLDLRNHFVPNSQNHANNVQFTGYLATVIRMEGPAKATIGIPDGGRTYGPISLNGRWLEESAYRRTMGECYLDVELPAGDTLLMMELQGTIHGHGFHFGVDCDKPFRLLSPLEAAGGETGITPFIGIGPFSSFEEAVEGQAWDPAPAEYLRARSIAGLGDLEAFKGWISPFRKEHVNEEDLFGLFVWTPERTRLPVPLALQNAVIANTSSAEVPLFPGEDTELVIDFGREYSGYVEFDVEAAEGAVLDFYGFEYMKDGWRHHTYQLDNTMRYVCREGRQRYSSPVRRGFRYLAVAVRNASGPVRLHRVSLLQSNYPIAQVGRFHSSDPMLNDIWEISRHTTRLCMEDTFVDCPAYEQVFWVGDARNEALVNYYLFGGSDIVKRCLKLVPGSRFQSDLYVDQVPSGWNSVIPNWTFFWITACAEYVQFTGDADFAAEIYPHVRFTLDAYRQRLDEHGLLNMEGWNFLDWAPLDQPRNGTVAHQNMFLVKALETAAILADYTDPAAGGELRRQAAELKAAINRRLWAEEKQAYVDCIHTDGAFSAVFSMQTQVAAFLAGVPDGEKQRRVEDMIQSPPPEFVQIGSPFMSFFYHEALAALNRFDLLFADLRSRYSEMVNEEATTCWETYPKPLQERAHPLELTRSHCHAWSAGPGYFLGKYVLGVRGENDGWSRIAVEPQIGSLDWARGAVPLPSGGRVDVSWQADRQNRIIRIRVEAPAGISLRVAAPEGYTAQVEEVRLG